MPRLLIILLLGMVASSFAQSQLGREFTQIQEQQVKAAAVALEPVNRRYQAALEGLLRRATQAGDLQTAVAVSEEIKRVTAPAASGPGEKVALPADGLEKRLIGTKWFYYGTETITFLEGGKAKWQENSVDWPWKVKNSGLRVIEGTNANKGAKWTLTFDSALKTGLLEGSDGTRTIRRVQ